MKKRFTILSLVIAWCILATACTIIKGTDQDSTESIFGTEGIATKPVEEQCTETEMTENTEQETEGVVSTEPLSDATEPVQTESVQQETEAAIPTEAENETEGTYFEGSSAGGGGGL